MSNTVWRKSSRSGPNGGECVELTTTPGTVAVRDSKNPDGPMLTFSRDTFRAFAAEVKNR
jgi:Domain of unknown function (DUF397)